MNQILQIEKKYGQNKNQGIKDIVLFLIIVIVVFGLLFGGYLLFKNVINPNIINPPVDQNKVNPPEETTTTITLTRVEKNNLTINVESKVELTNITYGWNNMNLQVIDLEGKSNIEKNIEIPLGENTIYISVTDINGEETTKNETFIREVVKPEIELSVVGNYIKIIVTSEEELSQIKYKWTSQEEKIENMLTYQDRNNFEKKIEIPVGKNELTVIAIDAKGETTEKKQEIKGITKATTTTSVKDGYWHFTVTGKENIKTVEFEFNGKKYLMNETTYGKTKIVSYKVKLVQGTNYLKITSTTESDGVDTTSWEQQYTQE